MTETVSGRGAGRGRPQSRRAEDRTDLRQARRAPLRRGDVGAARRRPDQLAHRRDGVRAAGRGVPRLLVAQRLDDRHDQVLPRRRRHRRARVEPAPAHRPGGEEIRAAGEEFGYFAGDDADIFEHELTWMLLHQVFSFNRPVWFNVGTASPQQVSACQPYDALVSTPAGLVPIGELVEQNAVGAKVFDAHGVTRIVAVRTREAGRFFEAATWPAARAYVTADHLVWKSSGVGAGRSCWWRRARLQRRGDRLEWTDPAL